MDAKGRQSLVLNDFGGRVCVLLAMKPERDEIELVLVTMTETRSPLAGEGWGGGRLRTTRSSRGWAFPHPPRLARRPPPQAGEVKQSLLIAPLKPVSPPLYHPSSTILPRDLPDSSKAWARLRLAALIVPNV